MDDFLKENDEKSFQKNATKFKITMSKMPP